MPLVVACLGLAYGRPARAYTYESQVGAGCHERLTAKSLQDTRAARPNLAVTPLDSNTSIMADEVPFAVPGPLRDLEGLTLLVGVRDPDVKGRSGLNTEDLPEVHGADDNQAEHCLRRSAHDGTEGSQQALADCRALIAHRIDQALSGGLDQQGNIDHSRRTLIDVFFAFSGTRSVELPTFYFRLGQALHTLQDGFTHTYRTPDHRRVTTVLNWVDVVADEHDATRDGPSHLADMDTCDDADPFRAARRRAAQLASTELLAAATNAARTPAERRVDVEAVLTKYFTFESGCDAKNNWCGAPEEAYRGDCSCRAAGVSRPASTGWHWATWSLIAAFACLRRRTRHALRPPHIELGVATVVALTLAILPAEALGSEPRPDAPPLPPLASAATTAGSPSLPNGLGFHLGGGASLDNPAFAATVGLRFGHDRALFGVDAEFNPWVSISAGRVALGTFNAYVTAAYRLPIDDHLALRSSARVGTSTLLFDTVGGARGSTGPLIGASLLALSYTASPDFDVIVNPADVILAVPQIDGAPITYLQYRVSAGIEFGYF